jgi:hypothetical protein
MYSVLVWNYPCILISSSNPLPPPAIKRCEKSDYIDDGKKPTASDWIFFPSVQWYIFFPSEKGQRIRWIRATCFIPIHLPYEILLPTYITNKVYLYKVNREKKTRCDETDILRDKSKTKVSYNDRLIWMTWKLEIKK